MFIKVPLLASFIYDQKLVHTPTKYSSLVKVINILTKKLQNNIVHVPVDVLAV